MKKFAEMSVDDTDHLIERVQRKLSRILPADTVAVVVLTSPQTTRSLVITQLPPLGTVKLLKQVAGEVEMWAIESN